MKHTAMRYRVLLIAFPVTIVFVLCISCGQNKRSSPSENGANAEVTKPEAAKPEIMENDADSKGKPLGVRSGIVEYKYSGDKAGKSIHYFDDYGMKSAVYSETVSQGETIKGWTVSIGEDQYMWDLSSPGQGMKMKNQMVKMLTESSGNDVLSYMSAMYEQMGLTKSGTETFQGKECTVYRGDIGKVLLWKGILMKMEMNLGTMVSRQEVVSIKTNIPVDNKYFQIPGTITFSEIPGF
jgi:hypothetical protein